MEFKYLIPIYNGEEPPYIITINAKSLKHAEQMFMKMMVDEYESIDYPADINDLYDSLSEIGVTFGEFVEINTI